MEASNFKIGENLIVDGKNYSIRSVTVLSEELPNLKKANPHIDLHIVIAGGRGGLRDAYVATNGRVILLKRH
jgi:hypothetical protein